MNPLQRGRRIVQDKLDSTSLLICHNAAHDLIWLWESGFTYDGDIADTMLMEYVLQRGQKEPLSLEACAERYQLDTQKQDTLKEYFKKGYSVRDIPHDELSMYLSADLHATMQLFRKLRDRYSSTDAPLNNTMLFTNRIAKHLTKIYQRGFAVNLDALEDVRKEFEQEKQTLLTQLQEQVRDLMGDRPINLNSPEQLSLVIYSRAPQDKKTWADLFDNRMNDREFSSTIKLHSDILYKQKAHQCGNCKGVGKVHKIKKDGTPFAKSTKCLECEGSGYLFVDDKRTVAGL